MTIETHDRTEPLVREIVQTLGEIDRVDRLWTRGIVHRGGPHYRLTGTTGPVSIGEDECALVGQLIARFRPANGFIIGNGFGLSSAFISTMMARHGGASVVTIDDMTEGDGQRCFRTAQALAERLDCRLLRSKYGSSPRDIVRSAESDRYDFVLIDGNHAHPQALEDFRGIQPLLHQRSIVCWHDYWLPGVAASVADAAHSGFHCMKVNSSSELAFATRDAETSRAIASLFDVEPPRPRSHPLARLMLSRSFVWGALKARFLPT